MKWTVIQKYIVQVSDDAAIYVTRVLTMIFSWTNCCLCFLDSVVICKQYVDVDGGVMKEISTNCFPLTLTIYHKFVENLLYFWDARLTCICIKHFITCELENLSFQTRIFQEALNAKPRIWVNICWRKVFFKNGLMYRHTASSTLPKRLDDRKIGAKDFSNVLPEWR